MSSPHPWPDYSQANSVHQMLLGLSPQEVQSLFEEMRRECLARGIVYEEDDGTIRAVPVLIRPRLLAPHQVEYFRRVAAQMNSAFAKLGRWYRELPALGQVFKFNPAEQIWMDRYLPACLQSPDALVMRWDANASFSGRHWRGQFSFFEANGVGVGGMHYGPAVDGVMLDVVLPRLRKLDPSLILYPAGTACAMLHRQLLAHARSLGIEKPTIGLVVDCRSLGGPVEFDALADFFQSQGTRAIKADARDLRLNSDGIYAGGRRLDVLYRDTELSELAEYEADGEDLAAMHWAFRENRVLSSIAGELDQKSALEVFSDPAYAEAFTRTERVALRRHVLWTRVLRDRRTSDERGLEVDLLPHVARRRDHYVIKPNRAFGGRGVVIGKYAESAAWDAALQEAARKPGDFVVQQRAVVSRKKFPTLLDNGAVVEVGLHVVCGVYVSGGEVALIGRASGARVVNVAQKGGLTSLLVCQNR